MTAVIEKTGTHHAAPTGKGLVWQADSEECIARGWYARWVDRWELVTAETAGAVPDLARLASVRAGQGGERGAEWRALLEVRNAGQWVDPGERRKRSRAAGPAGSTAGGSE